MALLMALGSVGMMASTLITVLTFSLWFSAGGALLGTVILLEGPFAAEIFGGATPFF
jgi:ABC-type molybdate transport system permease subunit